jgi:predicted ABC-type ATPase
LHDSLTGVFDPDFSVFSGLFAQRKNIKKRRMVGEENRSVDIRAGRLMLEEIAFHVRRRESFAFETTLSARTYARRIPRW